MKIGFPILRRIKRRLSEFSYDKSIEIVTQVADDVFVCGGGAVEVLWRLRKHPLPRLPIYHR
jgi:hypothetical protein